MSYGVKVLDEFHGVGEKTNSKHEGFRVVGPEASEQRVDQNNH